MENYTSLKQIKEALKDKSSKIYQDESFMFKGFSCYWADYDYRNPVLDRLRCDPSTDKQYEDFRRLQKNLQGKLIVDLS